MKTIYVGCITLLLCMMVAMLSGCLEPEEKFHEQQMVRMKIDGRKAMVTATNCPAQDVQTREQLQPCEYLIKYRQEAYNPPYSTMWVKEFELEAIESVIVGGCTVENGAGVLIPFPCEMLHDNLLQVK